MTETQIREAAINIRALPAQRNLIDLAAAALHKSRSDFMLEAACREAENILLNQRLFLVDDADFTAFETALQAPVSTKAKELLARQPPWK